MANLGTYEKARKYVEQHTVDQSTGRIYTHGPVITFSRETGAGANFVCDELHKLYDEDFPMENNPWAIFDKNLIDAVISDHSLPEKLKQYMEEAKLPGIATAMNELFGVHPPMVKLIHDTAETILRLSRIGYCMIIGRGANYILERFERAVHIRLIAPEHVRIRHMQTHYDMDFRTAADFIKKEDINRRKYVETHFGRNPDEPHAYHLVINTGLISFEESALIIKRYVEQFMHKHHYHELMHG